MKAKSIMIIVLAVLLAGVGVGGYFMLKKNKPKDPMVGVSAVNTITAEQNELDKVAVKLVDSKNAVLVANAEVYNGTYTKINKTTAEITCVVEESTHTFKYVLESDEKYIEETTVARSEEILSEKVELKETEDYVFDTGLWEMVANYFPSSELFFGNGYSEAGETSFIYNIENKYCFSMSGTPSVYERHFEMVGDVLIYRDYYMSGQQTRFSGLPFYVEKAGEHDEKLNALRQGGFGDLIYDLEHDNGDISRFYYEKVKEADYEKFDITEDFELKASMIQKQDETGNQDITVDTRLTIRTNGTVRFIQKNNNNKVNFDVTGKWYNFSRIIIIVLDNNADYFKNYFALGAIGLAGNTVADLKENGATGLDYGTYGEEFDHIGYSIYWTDANN